MPGDDSEHQQRGGGEGSDRRLRDGLGQLRDDVAWRDGSELLDGRAGDVVQHHL